MPRRPQTPEEFAQVRDRLVATARAIHAQDGAEAVTLRNVARRAGVSPAAIYRYFQDADALIAAAWEEDASRLAQRMQRAAAAGSHRARLGAMLRAYADFALEDMAAFRAGFLRLAARGTLAVAPFAVLLAEVAAASADGAIVPGDTTLTAQTLWAVMNGVLGQEQPMPDQIEYAINVTLRGIAGEG